MTLIFAINHMLKCVAISLAAANYCEIDIIHKPVIHSCLSFEMFLITERWLDVNAITELEGVTPMLRNNLREYYLKIIDEVMIKIKISLVSAYSIKS